MISDSNIEAQERRQEQILSTLSAINFPMHPNFCTDEEHSDDIKCELDRIMNEANHLKEEYVKADKVRDLP